MSEIRELLYELVSVQSDTGTKLEVKMGEKIFDIIRRNEYFAKHPELCGMESGGDFLGRSVVWALKKGSTNRTVILSGHYDAVEIDSYGELKPYALEPDELKKRLKEVVRSDNAALAATEDNNWLFGRGAADMKAGIAINLHALFTTENAEASVLFAAVCDEENLSAGCRTIMPLLSELRRRFGLDYRLCVITEPQLSSPDEPNKFSVYCGGTGKMLPMIMAKGKLAHCAQNIEGLNAAYMLAEAVRNIELNPELMSSDLGISTQSPSFQIMKDMKTTYDVSMPEYAVGCANILFLGEGRQREIMEKLRDICLDSFKNVMTRYNATFDICKNKGLVTESLRLKAEPVVMSFSELCGKVKEVKGEGYAEFIKEKEAELAEKINSGELNMQQAAAAHIRTMIEASLIDYPAFVIGMAPPYYPANSNEHLDCDISVFEEAVREVVTGRYGYELDMMPYLPGMADISYMSCTNPAAEKALMEQLSVPRSLYDIPFDDIAALNIPCYNLGPHSGNVHQMLERVWLPDVEKGVPETIAKISERA